MNIINQLLNYIITAMAIITIILVLLLCHKFGWCDWMGWLPWYGWGGGLLKNGIIDKPLDIILVYILTW